MNENQVTTERTENIGVVEISMPEPQPAVTSETAVQVIPINYQTALARYTEEEQKEIIALADSIDVTKLDNVMHYGAPALKSTFEQCGEFLKNKRGTQADQEVIARVVELSKKASESYEDFNLVLQKPSFMQRLLLKISSRAKNERSEKLQNAALSSFDLLTELKESSDAWLEILREAMGEIEGSAIHDYETIGLLEKYLVAGKIAEERIQKELKEKQTEYEETGLQQYALTYEQLKEGSETFAVSMANLEKSRVLYYLSIGQLGLIRRANRSTQMSIHTQVDNSLTALGQQLRNAILNATNEEVLEGQKGMTKLTDELINDLSKNVGLTAQEAEKAMYAGFCNTQVIKDSVTTVINSCEAVKGIATEMLPKMKADLTELSTLIKELEPHVNASVETLKIEETKASPNGEAKLTF